MSARPGNPAETIITAITLGGAAGRNFQLNNSSFAIVDAIAVVFLASATVGNRAITFELLDPAGNLLWMCAIGTAITAGQVVRLMAGAGVAPGSVATPLLQYLPLPSELAVPPNSSLQIVDAANISGTDQITSGVVSYAL